MNKKYKYLYNNIALFTVANFGTRILSFLFVGIYTGILTTAEYGMVSLISTTAGLIAPFVTINVSAAVQRFAFDKDYDKKKVFSVGIISLFCSSIILIIVCGILKKMHLFGWPAIGYLFVGLYVGVSSFNDLNLNFARAIDHVPDIVLASLLSTITTIVLNVFLLVYVKLGVLGYLIAGVSGTVVSMVFLFMRGNLWQFIQINKEDFALYKEMVHYSFPLVFNSIGWWVVLSSDRFFINAMLGDSENGIYSMAGKLSELLMTGLTIFNQAWNISALKESNDAKGRVNFYSKVYRSISSVVFVLSSLIIILTIPIASYLFKKDFFIAWKYSGLLILASGFNGLSSSLGAVFDVVKNTKAYAYSTIIAAILNVGLNACLIPMFGIYGAVIATDISFFTVWLIRYCLAKSYMDLHVSTTKSLLLLLLLVLQIVVSLTTTHVYLIQVLILLAIIILVRKDLLGIFKTMFQYICSVTNRNVK